MKKIAILSNSFPPVPGGGIESANYNLYKLLVALHYDVHVFTYSDSEINIKKYGKHDYISRFGPTGLQLFTTNILNILKGKIKKWFNPEKEDFYYAYQFNIVKTSQFGVKKLNPFLKRFNPDFIFIPDYGAPGYSVVKLKSAIYIHCSHHNPIRFLNNPILFESSSDILLAVRHEQIALKKVNRVLCVSNNQKDVFKKTFEFNGEIDVIPNYLDVEYINSINKFDLFSFFKIDKNFPIIYIPSAGNIVKGEKYVLELIRRISAACSNEVAFYLSGNLTRLQKYELSFMPHIKIFSPGMITYSENIAFIKSCKLCVSPALLESFGMAFLESLNCGIPVVTFNVGGIPDVVQDNINGFLVPYLDINILLEKTLLLINDHDKFDELVRNIPESIKQFSIHNLYEKYTKLLN